MLTKATVIGTGAMGTILAHVLALNGVHVALLGRRRELVDSIRMTGENAEHLPGVRLDERVLPTDDFRAALLNTELVLSAIPCQHVRSMWERLCMHVPAGVPVCSATKGIETSSLTRPTEIIASLAPQSPLAVLSGPSIAAEMARCLPCTVVAASASERTAELIQSLLTTHWMRVYTNPDVLGVELAGALKNVIALAAGILDGLHAGDNAKAALLTRGLVEITRLGVAMGSRPATFVGLAGVGDLVTTCVSPFGRNRTAGERLGSGESLESILASSRAVIEGIPTTQAVLRLADRLDVEMPITQAVHEVLFRRMPPLEAITQLMSRPLKAEDGPPI